MHTYINQYMLMYMHMHFHLCSVFNPKTTRFATDVNAVNRRFQRNRRGRPQQGRSQQSFQQGQKPQFTKPQQSRPPNASFTPAFTEKRTHKGKPTVKPANLCKWHAQFGKDAYTCEPGCDKFAGFQKPGKAQAGRQT